MNETFAYKQSVKGYLAFCKLQVNIFGHLSNLVMQQNHFQILGHASCLSLMWKKMTRILTGGFFFSAL